MRDIHEERASPQPPFSAPDPNGGINGGEAAGRMIPFSLSKRMRLRYFTLFSALRACLKASSRFLTDLTVPCPTS